MGKGAILTTYFSILTVLVSHSYSFPVNENDLKIIEVEPSTEIIPYVKGLALTCYAKWSHEVYWNWYEDNGSLGTKYSIEEDATILDRQSSRIWLKSTDDLVNNYTCRAHTNVHGVEAKHTFTVSKPLINTGGETWVLIAALTAVAILVVVIILGLICFKMTPKRPSFDPAEVLRFFKGDERRFADGMLLRELDDYADLKYDRSKEIKIGLLFIGRLVGTGQFGEVHAAILLGKRKKGPHRQVVVKRPLKKCDMSHEEFDSAFKNFVHKEIKLSQEVGSHPFIVGYVGAVTKNIDKYSAILVLEYCSGGDLENYLKKYQRRFQNDILNSGTFQNVLKTSNLLKWAEQIAGGLEYLGSKFVPHMDLAARNILLAHQNPALNTEEHLGPEPYNLIAKIADFGMARRLTNGESDSSYALFHPEPERNKPKWVPLRWMSLEAVQTFKFTLSNDIWSLGVLYWEMFSLGELPYAGLRGEPQTQRMLLIEFFQAGQTLPKPIHAPNVIWEIMKQTWNLDPAMRPSPQIIKEKLSNFNDELRNQLERVAEDQPSTSSVATPPGYSSFQILEGQVTSNTE